MNEIVSTANLGNVSTPFGLIAAAEQMGIKVKPDTISIWHAGQGLLVAPALPVSAPCKVGDHNLELKYSIDPSSLYPGHIAVAKLSLDDPISQGRLGMMAYDGDAYDPIGVMEFSFIQIGGDLWITSDVFIKKPDKPRSKGFHGLGIGTALALMSNIVIRDVLGRLKINPEDYEHIYAEILDRASGVEEAGVNRDGWSTNIARLLGYREAIINGLSTMRYDFK